MSAIELEGVRKEFPGGHVALRELGLRVEPGELFVLVGPSGCGKSTALRLIAGLESPTRGRIRIGGEDVTDRPPPERDVAMVFQSYALYPHLSVEENLGFGLRMRRTPKPEIRARVQQVAEMLGIGELLPRKPAQLSGGQRQRVALGRALARRPRAFLLDEPLSNLDASLRMQMRTEIARLHREVGTTTVYVTHDQQEAMTLGDRVAVLGSGELQQVAAPMALYERPANRFVAQLVGSPSMNLLRCRLSRSEGELLVQGPELRLHIGPPGASRDVPREAWLGIRPQDLRLVDVGSGDADVHADVVEVLGDQCLVHVRMGEEELTVVTPPHPRPQEGVAYGLRCPREHLHFFDAESGERLELQEPAHSLE